ncbi:hypothetical protein N7G274_005137 [Stereocaulon virgatum]|uniref:Uncharacterized protein n=1 Tax=Stereocaulon virgatum TaxID=373712 RepID=A0ABR4A8X0_9LECA
MSNILYVSHKISQFPSRRPITIICREWPFLTRYLAWTFFKVFRSKVGIFTVMWNLFERIALRDEGHVNLVVDLVMALRGTDPDIGEETPVVSVVKYMKGYLKLL